MDLIKINHTQDRANPRKYKTMRFYYYKRQKVQKKKD